MRGEPSSPLHSCRSDISRMGVQLVFAADLRTSLWWSNAVATLVLVGMIARDALEMTRNARRADFHGGCGCQ